MTLKNQQILRKKEILENLFPDGLVELFNKNLLIKTTINVAKNKNLPKKNIYTSDQMINKTINLYESVIQEF